MRPKHLAPLAAALALVVVACGGDDDSAADDTTPPTTLPTEAPADDTTPPTTLPTEAPADSGTEPVTAPATIAADDQTGDGTSVSIASVSLPTDGFVVIHADGGGSPGPIIGWSDLIPAGDHSELTVQLQEPLADSATVFPMAHVDANGNGEYEFMPPDVTIDVPATTADGVVAVVAISIEVADAADDAAAGLALAASDLGGIIVGSDGFTVYLFTPDARAASTCYGGCEANWPIVAEVASVGDGLDASLLGTTTRTDGTVQATYNGWPLYYFAGDAAAGDVNGQGVNDAWWVIDAAGDAVGT